MKLTMEINDYPFYTGTDSYQAYSFTPLDLPGFSEYQLTYSQFRILKAKLYLTYPSTEATPNYLVVGSRPFAQTVGPKALGSNASDQYVPLVSEAALRQARWQKVHYPSRISSRISIGFYPYTMVASQGPTTITGAQWARRWEMRNWTPFNWASLAANSSQTSSITGSLLMYGPYVIVQTPSNDTLSEQARVSGTLTVMVQFKGQR